MKLKITDVMICEWDAVTKCMIVSPAEGWKVNVNYPISEAHASMVTMEKMEGNGDELIGKWVKCTDGDGVLNFTPDRWYKCIGNVCEAGAFSGDFCGGGFSPNNHKHFDLTDARDYNPDERKPHQLKEYDAVECTPEERAEIIMIADECGVRVFAPTEPLEGQTSLLFFRGVISGTSIRSICDDAGIKRDWHTVPDFIAKIRGTYTEETKIPFDLERWKAGDFVRVETVEGHQVDQLVAFQLKDSHAMAGVVCGCFASWTEAGIFVSVMETDKDDLILIVKQ